MQWTSNWSETETGTPHAGGVADEWVTQLLRQGDAKVFKKYSQMKLRQMKAARGVGTAKKKIYGFDTV
jgi:hypothetical protein